MDELLRAFAESLAHAGPIYVLVFGALILFVSKVWPTIVDIINRREDREDKRELRVAEHEHEVEQLNGKWLVVSEQSSKAMEGMTSQMKVLNATLQDSKDRSRVMSKKVDDIHEMVKDIQKNQANHM